MFCVVLSILAWGVFAQSSRTTTTTETLPTGSETTSVTLPTSTETETVSMTLPTRTDTSTLTDSVTLPTPTETATVSVTLPTRTDTLSGTLTDSMTLPTPTETATVSVTLPTRTDTLSGTLTDSVTLPTPTETATVSVTLPTRTDTLSGTSTLTDSVTLPTPTETATVSVTLPTRTDTLSGTSTLTGTETLPTPTETPTSTVTLPTPTETATATETFSVTESITPTITGHEVPALSSIMSATCTTMGAELHCFQSDLTVTIKGTGFPTTTGDITSLTLMYVTGDMGAAAPTCTLLTQAYSEVTCSLSASQALGTYKVGLTAYTSPELVATGDLYVVLSGTDSWGVQQRSGTVYAPTTVTFQVARVADGDRVYLVREGTGTNCTDSVVANATETSVTGTGVGATATFDTRNLRPGAYLICYPWRNTGEMVLLANYPVYLRGALDVHRSFVCCDDGNNTMVVGDETVCVVHALDSAGYATGSVADECNFGFPYLKDGAGQPLCDASALKPRYSEPGKFTFSFVSLASGCGGRVGVSYRGVLLQGKVVMLTFLPGPSVPAHATSSCTVGTGSLQCNVTKRDVHHNPTEVCFKDYGIDPSPLKCEKL